MSLGTNERNNPDTSEKITVGISEMNLLNVGKVNAL